MNNPTGIDRFHTSYILIQHTFYPGIYLFVMLLEVDNILRPRKFFSTDEYCNLTKFGQDWTEKKFLLLCKILAGPLLKFRQL